MIDKLDMIKSLPEKTIEDLRAKVNCFHAQAIDCQNRAAKLQMESKLYQSWAEVTYMKLADAIMKRLAKR